MTVMFGSRLLVYCVELERNDDLTMDGEIVAMHAFKEHVHPKYTKPQETSMNERSRRWKSLA